MADRQRSGRMRDGDRVYQKTERYKQNRNVSNMKQGEHGYSDKNITSTGGGAGTEDVNGRWHSVAAVPAGEMKLEQRKSWRAGRASRASGGAGLVWIKPWPGNQTRFVRWSVETRLDRLVCVRSLFSGAFDEPVEVWTVECINKLVCGLVDRRRNKIN